MQPQRAQYLLNPQVGPLPRAAHCQQQRVPTGLGGKDLIIRMLAEVFVVSDQQSSLILDGRQRQHLHQQARWEQVSSSLVPVSLYSRTTSKWLNYLVNASKVATSNTASAMSPDSRDLLLLLQQFHRHSHQPATRQEAQNQRTNLDRLNYNGDNDESAGYSNEQLVFQVVAHDFVDGHCKKVLNVKMSVPGTRLGLASDYFVYWKDHSARPLQQQSSFNSNNTNTTTCCLENLPSSGQQLTWGLNFASTNDAKLFFDICSLNLVDLDFNSDYLKLLAYSDRNMSAPSAAGNLQQVNQQQSCFGNQSQVDCAGLSSTNKQSYASMRSPQQFCQLKENLNQEVQVPEVSQSCPGCRVALKRLQARLLLENNSSLNSEGYTPAEPDGCRLHHKEPAMRTRSRSSSRRLVGAGEHQRRQKGDGAPLKRARSLSTPATPEHPTREACPVHKQQAEEVHHPKCASFLARQKQSISDSEKPQKPARGVLRREYMEQASSKQTTPRRPPRERSPRMNADQVPVKRMPELRYPSLVKDSGWSSESREAPDSDQQIFSGDLKVRTDDERLTKLFNSNRASQRRSTYVEANNNDHFNSSQIRSASLARAQYANSKNMIEFLSLDAGGVQSTPTRMLSLLTTKSRANDKKLPRAPQAEATEVQQVAGATELRNVSTTTDDLPLDPVTKKRMFRLISDEQSETKASDGRHLARGGQDEAGSQTEEHPNGSQVRRRRSLGRSMCVDLDPIPDLSGLRQTSQAQSSKRSSHNLGHSVTHERTASNSLLNDNVSPSSFEQVECGHQGQVRIASGRGAKRARTKSAGDGEWCPPSKGGLDDDRLEHSCQYQLNLGEGFKASRSCGDLRGPHNQQHQSLVNNGHRVESCRKPRLFSAETNQSTKVLRNVPGLSTYVVPLCSGDEEEEDRLGLEEERHFHQAMRQCQSCPNSLRRGTPQLSRPGEPPIYHFDYFGQARRGPQAVCRGVGSNFAHCQKVFPEALARALEDKEDDLVKFSSGLQNLTSDGHLRTGSEHMAPAECRLCSGARRRSPSSHQQPLSSGRSSRSPIHFGLYESDCEDDLAESTPLWLETINERIHPALDRSSSAHLRLKPVQGYDQTLARAQLRCRRERAKSQPPASSNAAFDDVETSFQLTRSIENVQKLITEVQNELNALKVRPGCYSALLASEPAAEACRSAKQPEPSSGLSRNGVSIEENAQYPGARQHRWTGASNDPEMMAGAGSSATKSASQFKCVGAIRKAGFLSVKKWILKRRQSIELARKQGWKRYWVCLRGTALLFHSVLDRKDIACGEAEQTDLLSWVQLNCGQRVKADLLAGRKNADEEFFRRSMSQCYIEREPRHLIIIDGAIAQPIPEHPKREFVFCLSTTFGDAYLFQASCQLELDNWILAVHNACAASIARDLTRDEAVKLFETKIRHIELELDKKLFLKQRLESRLTTMTSMSHLSDLMGRNSHQPESRPISSFGQPGVKSMIESQDTQSKRTTMRSLLLRLNQQLTILDNYMEQLHCEVYQIRCYLYSCSSQNIFNQSVESVMRPFSAAIELPHPKSLLTHVSNNTKLLLIKMGVFTVSSLHAYIHARQGSSDNILQRIQAFSQLSTELDGISSDRKSPLELLVRSSSASDNLATFKRDLELENVTEELIHISNLRSVLVRVHERLFKEIKGLDEMPDLSQEESEEGHSLHNEGNFVIINLKLHMNTNCLSIIKQVLKVITKSDPNSQTVDSELEFLDYYLKFITKSSETSAAEVAPDDSLSDMVDLKASSRRKGSLQLVARRRDTLTDWSNFDCLELMRKTLFKVDLTRRRRNESEEASPFGLTIVGQLFSNKFKSLLNVFCNYVEWGSVADKAGLQDDDELLAINGVSVMDLDMMFIECIIRDESKLRLVVRSSRCDFPGGAMSLSESTRPSPKDDEEGDKGPNQKKTNNFHGSALSAPRSQLISDEYISSLVCPPPPTQSRAFFGGDSSFMRQKSELTCADIRPDSFECKSKSQVNLNDNDHDYPKYHPNQKVKVESLEQDPTSELIKRTEKLTRMLDHNRLPADQWKKSTDSAKDSTVSSPNLTMNSNRIERLRKSIIELLETEYAYIKHLETIHEHYMSPLAEMSYLNILDLRQLNGIIIQLINFQRDFFGKLVSCCSMQPDSSSVANGAKLIDDYDNVNKIIKDLDGMDQIYMFKPFLSSITRTFNTEADRFKIYTMYCASYSKLQKVLHPLKANPFGSNLNSIASVPNNLDTFQTSGVLGLSSNINIGGYNSHHREFLKPLGSLMLANNNDPGLQLKQLNEFLGNLDSSSSSVSVSLSKSSLSSNTELNRSVKQPSTANLTTASTGSSSQKCVHQQNFESYLIKPIQRIVKYPMLLNSILASAQQLAHEEENLLFELRSAVRQMEAIAGYVNDNQRTYDQFGLIFEHIERQYLEQVPELAKQNPLKQALSGSHQPPISLAIDQLLYFGPVEWLNIHEFTSKLKKNTNFNQMLFVFNSCVVFICREQVKATRKKVSTSNLSGNSIERPIYKSANQKDQNNECSCWVIRYQSLIPVSEVLVRSIPARGGNNLTDNENCFIWELFRCSSVNSNSSLLTKGNNKRNGDGKVYYLLSSATNEDRNTFLRKIRYIIRESVQNMSLPMARCPSSKTSTPRKLSSPTSNATTTITTTITTNTNSSCSQSTSLSPSYNLDDKKKQASSKKLKDIEDSKSKHNNQVKNYTSSIKVTN